MAGGSALQPINQQGYVEIFAVQHNVGVHKVVGPDLSKSKVIMRCEIVRIVIVPGVNC